jgi:Cu(I)/Ag(I) efflux system protein CusF
MLDMRSALLRSITIALFAICVACGANTPKPSNPVTTSGTPVATSSVELPKDGNYNGKGTVTKINNELGSIELDHGEIPGVMPPMIMEFFVKDKAILEGLAVGDNVDFVLEYKHPAETVVSVTKIK